MPYIRRSIEGALSTAAAQFPAVVLTGTRQSGKTTLLRHLFGAACRYVNLDLPDARALAVRDPRAFLLSNPPPVILDEVQNAPDLLLYIKAHVDDSREARGQFLLSGSQDLLMLERVSESLAGRAAVLRLMPLSRREIEERPTETLPWERAPGAAGPGRLAGIDAWAAFVRGCYPQLIAEPYLSASLWHAAYSQTYLERDVRSIRQIGDLVQFQAFVAMLAARSGQLLNMTDVGRDLGIDLNTVKAWLSVLQATFQIQVIRPYYANAGKRLVKTPKVYFMDTGTLCHLMGLRDAEHAAAGPTAGAIFETAVLSEIVKTVRNRGLEPRIWFWRTARGAEVDFIVEDGPDLIPIEARTSATPRLEMAAGIRAFAQDYGDRVRPGWVVHPGDVRLPLGEDVTAIPFAEL